MKFELNSLPRNCSNEEVLVEIRRVDALVGKDKLTRADFDKHAKISSDGIKMRFGNDWKEVLIAAELGHKYSGRKISDSMKSQKTKDLTNEEILNEIRRIAKKLGREYITREDIRVHSEIITPSIVIYRFGSLICGLEKVGLKVAPAYKRKLSENEYFENLLNVWTHYGRQPFLREMDNTPSIISSRAYEGRFRRWRKALEAFVAKMNAENGEVSEPSVSIVDGQSKVGNEEIPSRERVNLEETRNISLSLRYKVLSRDGFRCVRCGRSPATHVGLELHVDHKKPFSKQGKTVLENLETKCRDCNLGKGNRHSE